MTENTRISLRELQQLDLDIQQIRKGLDEFGVRLDELEEPALQLESELSAAQKRLQEIKLEERRLEGSADDKRARSKRLQERMNTVRNLREEAAVHAELDLVRRALEGDEQEALGLLDQIRKVETRVEELDEAHQAAQAELAPRRTELMEEHAGQKAELDELIAKRDAFADQIDEKERRMYDSIKAGGRAVVVAELTADGACGHCFSVIPLQLQTNIRSGTEVIRCEACGVIIAAPMNQEEE
jgi:predicted  nucleic acid-binding Zn-ribbon protein